MRSSFLWYLFVLTLSSCLCVAVAATAHADTHDWSSAEGDLVAYHQAGLPDPIVIYVFARDGKLLRIFNPHGQYGKTATRRIESMLEDGPGMASDQADKSLAAHGLALTQFLLDNGVPLHEVIDPHARYTLVVALLNGGEHSFPPDELYKRMVADVTTRPSNAGKYGVFILKLGSSTLNIVMKHVTKHE